MKKEIIAECTYTFPEPTDEEILGFAEAEGVTNINPEDVRRYIRESIYKLYCEAVNKIKEENSK